MKSSKIKIMSSVVLSIVLIFVGVLYYASTKLNPEEIKKLTIEQTQKIFPNATVSLEGVDINWGFNFKVELKKFTLKTKSPSGAAVEMMSVDDFFVKVPIWAIISNAGVIEIQLEKPLVNYAEFATGNNWSNAMGAKKPEDDNANSKDSKDGISSPDGSEKAVGLFGKSKINIKLSDVAIQYTLRDQSKGQIGISRFLVKGLNFESSTAFEIASDAKFQMADKSLISFSTMAIGEINIADLVKNGSVTSLVIVKVNNISKTGLEWKFPEINTNINFLLKKDGEISGKIETSFESQNRISAQFKVSKQIEINDINVDIILKDIGAIIGLDRSIDLAKSKLTSRGELVYTEDKKIHADLSFTINPGIGYSKDGINATTSVEGSFKGKDIFIKVKTDVLGGAVETLVNGEFDPNQKFDLRTLKPFDIKIAANKLKIPEKLIQEKLWTKKELDHPEESQTDKITAKEKSASPMASQPPTIPAATVNISWVNINVGGEDFSGKGKVVLGNQAIAIDNLNFKFSKGAGKLTQTTKLGVNANDVAFDFGITDLNLSSFKPFLPPFIENFSGVFSGKINGTATMFKAAKPPKYDVNVAVDARKGELKKLNISQYINPLLEGIPLVKDQVKDKQVKIDGSFDTLVMKGRFTNAEYTLSNFNFVGLNKKVEINGSGVIMPEAGTSKVSQVEVNFLENGKIGEVLTKNIGTKILPMKLTGPGYAMKPDVQFTLSKVAKGAAKTKGAELAQKVIEKNMDKIEKIIPEKAREQVKGLLNGLFKKK